MQGESGVESVDAAAEIDPTKGSATASPSRAAVQPAQVQGQVDARYWYDGFYAEEREQALTERLVLVLTGSSHFPATSGQPLVATELTVGMVDAVHSAVERVWRAGTAELPSTNGLKPKAHAWLAADLLHDPFMLPEDAERLGKAMQTRAAALKREEQAERHNKGKERRAADKAAKEGTLEGSLDAALQVIANRLDARLLALNSSVYPTYARFLRVALDDASESPVVAAAAAADAAETTAPETDADVADAAAVVAAVAANDARPRRTRSSEEGDRDEWDEGHDAGVALGAALRSQRAANRYHKERLEIGELHEKELKAAIARERLMSREELLFELSEQISKVKEKVDERAQHLFSRREMAGAFDPLSEWVEQQMSGGEVPLQEQIEQASLAAHDAMWAAAEKDTPPYWAKGEEYHGRL